ncbi:MerR family transcriptional regulator [Pseudoalteromonas luteoviolacea]|uniref:MerR family transcriptional regulator n=1 Tax=Pseudoalteromonas luteoviolacea TaxID=43657 RepID=UPI001F39CC76|nr:MerR family transcriptional regulator [Pseudoalteromonas luteoviolacea]MCF6441842.1 MerR family transcriptional regulator [Pseudoalteromonas luteoviolacea]
MNKAKRYSVSQLSKLAGVSVRTLHHYDKIGLLKSLRGANGYREYTQTHLIKLQQIIVYKELEFSLEEIQSILNATDFDLLQVLKDQKSMLLKRQEKTQLIINSLENSMSILNGEKNLDILFKDLPSEKVERWKEMIAQITESGTLDEFYLSLQHLSNEEAEFEQRCFDEWVENYKPLLSLPVHSKEVQASVERHFAITNRLTSTLEGGGADFKGVSYEGYVEHADSVVSNDIARDMYEHYSIGMASHLHKAMLHFADNTLKGNSDKFKNLGLGNC